MKKQTLAALFGILIILLAVVFYQQQSDTKQFGSQQTPFITASLEEIDSITITRPQQKETINIKKQDGVWQMTSPLSTKASVKRIEELITHLSSITIGQPISEVPDRFSEMRLTEDTGTLVEIKRGEEVLAHFIIGKITESDYNNTFIRKQGEDKAYLASGAFEGIYNSPATNFRDKQIFALNAETMKDFIILYNKNRHTYYKEEGLWKKENNGEISSDAIMGGIRELVAMEAASFPDTTSINPRGLKDTHSLKIYMKDETEGSEAGVLLAKKTNGTWYGILENKETVYQLPAILTQTLEKLGIAE